MSTCFDLLSLIDASANSCLFKCSNSSISLNINVASMLFSASIRSSKTLTASTVWFSFASTLTSPSVAHFNKVASKSISKFCNLSLCDSIFLLSGLCSSNALSSPVLASFICLLLLLI
eukprot:NODE_210_length_14612_cov_0.470957.p7 type:complete len:118 gc:universal NODE_210_length_14612_cov_0.470957:7564-7917(+)